jgi:hypothetical protein
LVVELHELFLLGLDLREGALVALGFTLDHAGSLSQFVSQLGAYLLLHLGRDEHGGIDLLDDVLLGYVDREVAA